MHTTNRVASAWGAEIKARRTARPFEMSRAQLADHLGVTRQMVRLWEEGVHAPSAPMQGRLIQLLGIDPVTVAKLITAGGDAA